MPHQRIFNDIDPVLELKKHNTPLVVESRRRASDKAWESGLRRFAFEHGALDRQRKPVGKTASTTNAAQARNHHARKRKPLPPSAGRGSADQMVSGKLLVPSVRRPRASTEPSEFPGYKESQTKPHSDGFEENSATAEKRGEGLAHSCASNQGKPPNSPSSTKRHSNSRAERKRSASVPQGKYTSMAAIVRARSMAMKWYGGNKKRTGRQKIKTKSVLPTITDAAKFSLCSVNCSPQFAETVKLMEKDVGQDTTGQIDRDLQVLSLD